MVGVGLRRDDDTVSADHVAGREWQRPALIAVDPFEVDAEAAIDLLQRFRHGDGEVEGSGDALINDLDLELVSPSGDLYYGNFFTDDRNADGVLDPDEDCPWNVGDGTPLDGGWDQSEWSIEACVSDGELPPHDTENPTEAIFLSPNAGGTCDSDSRVRCASDSDCDIGGVGGSCGVGTSQIEAGDWTLKFKLAPQEDESQLDDNEDVRFLRVNDERIRVQSTTFAQPRWDDFRDYRLLSENALVVKGNDWLSVRFSARFAHDSRPPEGVEKMDSAVESALVLTL